MLSILEFMPGKQNIRKKLLLHRDAGEIQFSIDFRNKEGMRLHYLLHK